MRVFGKNHQDSLSKLSELLEAMRSDHPHLAKNIEVDDRVSLERAKHFTELVGEVLFSKGLEPALARYAGEMVRAQPDDTYLSPHTNGLNIPATRAFYPEFLGHVMNVNSISRSMAQEDRGREYGYSRLNPAAAAEIPGTGVERIDQILREELLGTGPGRRRPFVDAILRYHGELGLRKRLPPVWAADWTLFESAVNVRDEPDRWNSLVGAYRGRGTWLLVLKYNSSEIMHLVRPTQLEAGCSDHHFPTPSSTGCEKGGLCMNLIEPDPAEPVPEYLHRPIQFHLEQWEAAGARLGFQVNDPPNSLNASRKRHLRMLQRLFGAQTIENWWEQ